MCGDGGDDEAKCRQKGPLGGIGRGGIQERTDFREKKIN